MTEASRVQKLLVEQNAEIDKLKNRIEQLEAEVQDAKEVFEHQLKELQWSLECKDDLHQQDYRRMKKLEAALRDLSTDWDCCFVSKTMKNIARKALEGKDD